MERCPGDAQGFLSQLGFLMTFLLFDSLLGGQAEDNAVRVRYLRVGCGGNASVLRND